MYFSLTPAEGEGTCYSWGRQLSSVRVRSFFFHFTPVYTFPYFQPHGPTLCWAFTRAVKLVAESLQFINLAGNIWKTTTKHRAMFSCVATSTAWRRLCTELTWGGDSTGVGFGAGSEREPPFAESQGRCIPAVVVVCLQRRFATLGLSPP